MTSLPLLEWFRRSIEKGGVGGRPTNGMPLTTALFTSESHINLAHISCSAQSLSPPGLQRSAPMIAYRQIVKFRAFFSISLSLCAPVLYYAAGTLLNSPSYFFAPLSYTSSSFGNPNRTIPLVARFIGM